MIHIVGLGPGNKEYILPIAMRIIKEASVVIGAKRNLASVLSEAKDDVKVMDLSVGFAYIGDYIKAHRDENIAMVVSGDSGFYSMRTFVQRYVTEAYINLIPGISSLQYMYSRIGKGYEQAQWLSLHGRDCDLITHIKNRRPLGILTDQTQNNHYIAEQFKAEGNMDAVFYIGERLSYSDEKITRLTVDESLTYEADSLSVVVVDYE